MLNRRAFVHSLGLGTAGAFTLWQTDLAACAAQLQRAAAVDASAAAIRISSNENPYGPLPTAVAAARAAAADGHRYPGPAASKLSDAIAKKHGVLPARVLLSGGSGDVLRSALMAFTGPTHPLVTGSPSYEAPVRQAQRAGAPVIEVPLTSDLNLDLDAMLAKSNGAGIVYICNPNNPTSTVVPLARVTELIAAVAKSSPATQVLVDEAYFEYVDDPAFGTVIPLVEQYPNLIVARTFSKIYGMAGMRVGYAVAQEKTLASMRENLSASGISALSFAAASASIADVAGIENNRALNRAVRAFTVEAFKKAGYNVAASQANFVMVNVRRDSRGFLQACGQKGVAVGRPFPPLSTWARITIGTQQEMDRALSVVMDVLASPPTSLALAPLPVADYLCC
jgi:histidinol-phosphate aminotransferase